MSLREKYGKLTANKKAIILYIVVSFALSWFLMIVAMSSGINTSSDSWGTIYLFSILFPGVSAVLVKRMSEDRRQLKFKPRFKGNLAQYAIGLFLPMLGVILGIVVYFLIRPQAFDINASVIVSSLAEISGDSIESARSVFYTNMLTTFLLAPFAQIILVFLEELGFRGYFLPKLVTEYGARKALIINGLVWGVWYSPLIILGHNYGVTYPLYPFTGILINLVFCLSIGSLMGYLTLKSGSVLPACLARSTIAATGGVGIFFCSSEGFSANEALLIGPSTTGILGMSVFVVIGIICVVKVKNFTWLQNEERFKNKFDKD